MAWTNLPTDYTDAIFTGLRKYVPVNNPDGTVSFEDVTVYSNREKSFFGASDANRMNEALNGMMDIVGNSPTMGLAEITLTASGWTNAGSYYTQPVTLEDVAENHRIDVEPDADMLLQMMNDGVSALYIENDGGTLTAVAIGAAPGSDLTVQVTKVGVPME